MDKGTTLVAGHVKVCVFWNGGWDEYLVDTTSVRDMTAEEAEEAKRDRCGITVGGWLRCSYLTTYMIGHEGQVVRIVRHLDGGDSLFRPETTRLLRGITIFQYI